MQDRDKLAVQELLAHPAWEIYRALILEDRMVGGKLIPCLKTRLQADLQSAAREGNHIRAASVAGQIDLLTIILEVPEKYIKSG